MCVEHDEAAAALPMARLADADPPPDRLVECQCPAAGDIHMLDRIADWLDGQEVHFQARWQQARDTRGNALRDDGVGLERQVRAMLLGRAERQYGDGLRVGMNCFAGCHVSVMWLWHGFVALRSG